MFNRWCLFQATAVTSLVQGFSAHILEEYIDRHLDSMTGSVMPEESRQQIASAITTCVSAYLGAKVSAALISNDGEVDAAAEPDDLLYHHGNGVALLAAVSSMVVNHFTKIRTSATFKVVSAVLAGMEFCRLSDEAHEVLRVAVSF